jgi:hypothetical protein
MKETNSQKLAKRIYNFLDKYAGISPDWKPENGEDDKYTSPDAYELKYCAELLEKNIKPTRCWSEWGSGGYRPYSSKEGREEHNSIVDEISKIIL